MKRIVCIVLTLFLLCITVVAGDSYTVNIPVSANTATVKVNGNIISADNFNYKGTIYIPLRSVTEAMGADVGWDQATKTASIAMNKSSNDSSGASSGINFTQIDVTFAWDYHLLNNCYDDLENLSGLALDIYATPSLQITKNLDSMESTYQQRNAYKDMLSNLYHPSNNDILAQVNNIQTFLNESRIRLETARASGNYLGSHADELELYNKIRSAGTYCNGQEMDFLKMAIEDSK